MEAQRPSVGWRVFLAVVGLALVVTAMVLGWDSDDETVALAGLGAGVLLIYLVFAGQRLTRVKLPGGLEAELVAVVEQKVEIATVLADVLRDPKVPNSVKTEVVERRLPPEGVPAGLREAAASHREAVDYEMALLETLQQLGANPKQARSGVGYDAEIADAQRRVVIVEAKSTQGTSRPLSASPNGSVIFKGLTNSLKRPPPSSLRVPCHVRAPARSGRSS